MIRKTSDDNKFRATTCFHTKSDQNMLKMSFLTTVLVVYIVPVGLSEKNFLFELGIFGWRTVSVLK